MSLPDRLRFWRRSASKPASSNAPPLPLREFAYLDDVSVLSLYSSRLGAVPESLTESQGDTSQTDLSAEAQVGFAGNTGKAGAKRSTTNSLKTEIVSKLNVQATFSKLLHNERPTLRLVPARGRAPRFAEPADRAALESVQHLPRAWFMSASELQRGDLIEIEVEVRATKLFSLNSLFSLFSRLAEIDPKTFGQVFDVQVGAVREAIDQFLSGLIPLNCVAQDYFVVNVNGEDLVIHRFLYFQTPANLRPKAYPLVVVGLTEERLFWRDIRRVVFSGSKYLMLGRVSRGGVSAEWEELKVAELIREISPPMAQVLRDSMQGAVNFATDRSTGDVAQISEQVAVQAFATAYLDRVLNTLGATDTDRASIDAEPIDLTGIQLQSAEGRGAIYREIERRVTASTMLEISSEVSAQMRDDFTSIVQSAMSATPDVTPATHNRRPPTEAYLEVEVVALYW